MFGVGIYALQRMKGDTNMQMHSNNANLKIFIFLVFIFGFWSLIFNFALAAGQGWKLEVSLPGLPAGTAVKDPGQYFEAVYKFAVALGAILAVVMIIYGGFLWMTSPIISSKEKGREMIIGAISGLILLLASYLILYTINPQLVGLSGPALESVSIGGATGGTGGGGTGGGGTGGGGTFTGHVSNQNAQKMIETFNRNPSHYAQIGPTCSTYCGYLEHDSFPTSTFHQYGYANYYNGRNGALNQNLINRWAQDLQNGIIPNPRVNGEFSGQHWINILDMNNNNITFYDPNGGRIRTFPINQPGAHSGYFFGSATSASDPGGDGWGGYITVP